MDETPSPLRAEGLTADARRRLNVVSVLLHRAAVAAETAASDTVGGARRYQLQDVALGAFLAAGRAAALAGTPAADDEEDTEDIPVEDDVRGASPLQRFSSLLHRSQSLAPSISGDEHRVSEVLAEIDELVQATELL